jgi:2-polyprenyl-6-hydroxyphenyl methylase/3-demethylubiquinone-9 3-methyltransferase
MNWYYDVIDWLGGYPFEVATPDQVTRFYGERGFTLDQLVTRAAGCNEFVFSLRKA